MLLANGDAATLESLSVGGIPMAVKLHLFGFKSMLHAMLVSQGSLELHSPTNVTDTPRNVRRRVCRNTTPVRPCLEVLEDRTLLSANIEITYALYTFATAEESHLSDSYTPATQTISANSSPISLSGSASSTNSYNTEISGVPVNGSVSLSGSMTASAPQKANQPFS